MLAGVLLPVGGSTHSVECPDYVHYVPADAQQRTYPIYYAGSEGLGSHEYWAPWIYAESNGVQGLQRDDDYCYNWSGSDSDTIIW